MRREEGGARSGERGKGKDGDAKEKSGVTGVNAPSPRRPPLQFRLRTLLILTAVFAIFLAAAKALGMPPFAVYLVMGLAGVSVVTAFGLVIAIAHSGEKR